MKTIYKYPMHDVEITIQAGNPKVIYVDREEGHTLPTVWVEVDIDGEDAELRLIVVGTGHPIPSGHDYVGTALVPPFVWHVYQLRNNDE